VGPLGFVPTGPRVKGDTGSKPGTSGFQLGSKYAHLGALKTLAIDDDSGEPIYNMAATWDYIQAHELFRKGLIDVGDVCERLKKTARCDGQGPVFLESDIRQAISDSAVAGGRDELI
jgi:hypothetical protein